MQSSECSQRLVPCQYCELELVFSQAKEHEDYCGTRTEPCPVCKYNIMLREKAIHPALCGSLTPPQERRVASQPPEAWFETQSIHNLLRGQERSNNNSSAGLMERRGPPRPLESRLHNSTRGAVGAGVRRFTAQRNNEFSRRKYIKSWMLLVYCTKATVVFCCILEILQNGQYNICSLLWVSQQRRIYSMMFSWTICVFIPESVNTAHYL